MQRREGPGQRVRQSCSPITDHASLPGLSDTHLSDPRHRKEARKSAKLAKGDTVEVILAATTAPLTLEGEDIPLEVLFEVCGLIA